MPKEGIKERLRKLPNKPGVYIMYNSFKQILYVGKAKSLKRRVAYYFRTSAINPKLHPKIVAMVGQIEYFDFYVVKSESEALLLESQLIKKYKPKYNTSLKDDKNYLLVQLNPEEDLPKFKLTRHRILKSSRYYGPFPHARALRKTLDVMKQKFGILLNDAKPKKIGPDTWKLYDDARAEISNLPNEVTQKEYRIRLANACEFLEGETEQIIKDLKSKMYAHAQNKNYEKAGFLRDQINAINESSVRTRKFERNLIGLISAKESLLTLKNALNLKSNPKHIECFDVSHISGSFCVAAMVCFKEGKPKRNQYRRYKIRSFIGNDDYKAIEEVIYRRYKRICDDAESFPDLIIIDGGKGQVNAALKAFIKLKINPNELIGLSKKNETIIFSDARRNLSLSLRDPALRLLQYLRDEAHAFANNFNADLRSQKIRESVLDDFKGIGEVKKNLLLCHFGSLSKLRKATIHDIIEIKGIGPILAMRLIEFLQNH